MSLSLFALLAMFSLSWIDIAAIFLLSAIIFLPKVKEIHPLPDLSL
jgi:hypothetical protein